MALLTQAGSEGLAVVVAGLTLFFLGGAPLLVLGTDLVVASAPPQRAGAASALSETAQEFGGALGLALLGSVAAAIYRNEIVVPDGVPVEAAEAARDTLGGAAATAGELPPELAGPLWDGARAAFTSRMQTAAVMAAAVLLVVAGLAGVLLRRTGPATPVADAPAAGVH
nr:hypothetical protein [Pseudonocardia nigra]